jgi:hypothetical protein
MAKTSDYLSLSIKLILVISIINGIYNSLWHLVSTNIFLLVLMFLPQIIKKYEIKFPQKFEWFLLLFVLLTIFLGKVSGIITPIIFGIAIAMIGFMISAILYSSNQIKKNYFLIILFSFNFAVALGFGIELLKYYLKIVLGHFISPELYSYSMQTMTFVILGALISAIFGYMYMKYKKGVFKTLAKSFTENNPSLFKNKEKLEKEILETIKKPESESLEFKSTLRTNIYTDEIDKKIEHSALKTIVAFMNSRGGSLFLGVTDDKKVLGIEEDKFPNTDKFLLHLTNLVKEKIGRRHAHLVDFGEIKIGDRTIIEVICKKSSRPVFLKMNPQQEEFFMRVGPSSMKLEASELVEYIVKRFRGER